ncbi:MAG: hypothetical protein ABW001_12065 [Mycobacterium sp.]
MTLGAAWATGPALSTGALALAARGPPGAGPGGAAANPTLVVGAEH